MVFSDSIKGDFDGDRKPEYLWVKTIPDSIPVDSCTILCSNSSIPPFRFQAMGCSLSNEGDLDNNRADEVTVNSWAEGAWGVITVYAFRKGKWIETIERFSVYGPDGHTDYVKKGPGKGEATIIRETWGQHGEFAVETKTVKLK
ncbi:MAG: hypothetical protein FD123_2260 [Bacteroidetes bacterium]|nr:MAG: hypothetical protein FD123_2260 [Bacteroidota bacterium]